jgi:hypothetical protein
MCGRLRIEGEDICAAASQEFVWIVASALDTASGSVNGANDVDPGGTLIY